MIVSDCQDVNLLLGDQVGQVVRKPRHWDTSNVEVGGKPIDSPSDSRRANERPDRAVNRSEEGQPQAGVTLFVPPCGVLDFSRRLGSESDPLAHPASSSASL